MTDKLEDVMKAKRMELDIQQIKIWMKRKKTLNRRKRIMILKIRVLNAFKCYKSADREIAMLKQIYVEIALMDSSMIALKNRMGWK